MLYLIGLFIHTLDNVFVEFPLTVFSVMDNIFKSWDRANWLILEEAFLIMSFNTSEFWFRLFLASRYAYL